MTDIILLFRIYSNSRTFISLQDTLNRTCNRILFPTLPTRQNYHDIQHMNTLVDRHSMEYPHFVSLCQITTLNTCLFARYVNFIIVIVFVEVFIDLVIKYTLFL